MKIFLAVVLMLEAFGEITAVQFQSDQCVQTPYFGQQSFELAYFPPDHSGYSMAILVGTFVSNTLVSEVIVSYSLDGSHQKSYSSAINITYFGSQLVQFAPWFNLRHAKKGKYSATLNILSQNQVIYCWPFTFDL